MQPGIMFRYGQLIILWIILNNVAEARHIQLATQRMRAQSRPRLLIIRPPEGSGQPNRIVVVANSRPQPAKPSPPLATAISSLQETAAAAKAGLDRSSDFHPQSQALAKSRAASGRMAATKTPTENPSSKQATPEPPKQQSSGSRPDRNTSLRSLLDGMRSRVHGTVREPSQSNVFRMSNQIPRALPPIPPVEQKFGALNMPREIEAELRRRLQQANMSPNGRQANIRPHGHHDHGMSQTMVPPLSGRVIDLSTVSLNDRGVDASAGSAGRATGSNPRWDIGTASTLGRNGILSRPGSWGQTQESNTGSGRDPNFIKNNDLLTMPSEIRRGTLRPLPKTGSNLRTFQDKSADISSGFRSTPPPTLDLQSLLMDTVPPQPSESFDLSNTVGTGQASSSGSASPTGSKQQLPSTADKTTADQTPSLSGLRDAVRRLQRMPPIPAPPSAKTPDAPQSLPAVPLPSVPKSAATGPTLKLNATAQITSAKAETNSTTNTTNTKSVKTKNVKVTTVVKGGTQADIAAAVASQAEIASAVAQGKEINSTALNNLAKAASGVAKADATANNNGPPVGSITVNRQPNGESVITLSDGQGEPVVLRATGPVKIERIVKPNGRIQFVINPLNTPPVEPPTTAMIDSGEIEPEDITTTMSSITTAGASTFVEPVVWSTSTPFYVDPASSGPTTIVPAAAFESATSAQISEAAPSVVSSNIEITANNTSNTSSQNSTTVSKTRTVKAKTETSGVMQLFPSQRIPPPPKLPGISFGNSDLFNPFFLDTNNFLQNSAFDMSSNGKPSMSASTKLPSSQGVNGEPMQLFPSAGSGNSAQSTTGQSDPMPQYKLLGVSPSLQFVSQGNTVP